MKIGIIFFGLPRCTEITLPSIQQFIIEPLAEHELFIESCFALQDEISSTHSKEQSVLDASNYDFFKQFPHQFVLPENLLETDLHQTILQFGDRWHDNGLSLKHLMMQLNCIQRAYLKCKQQNCDFYIFIRPDLLIHEFIPMSLFFKQHAFQRSVLVPCWQWYRGVNDRFAVVSKSAADTYGLRYSKIVDYCKYLNRPLHSETFLLYQLVHNDICIKTCTSKMSRVRVNGAIEFETFSAVKRMGGFKLAIYAHSRQLMFLDKLIGFWNIFKYYIAKFLKIKTKSQPK